MDSCIISNSLAGLHRKRQYQVSLCKGRGRLLSKWIKRMLVVHVALPAGVCKSGHPVQQVRIAATAVELVVLCLGLFSLASVTAV